MNAEDEALLAALAAGDQGAALVNPADLELVAQQLAAPPGTYEEDGVCFATFNDEVLGPFRCKADAMAAQDARLDELKAQGVHILGASTAVIFADPAIYHVPEEARAS